MRTNCSFVLFALAVTATSACNRFDAQRFEPAYRAGKAVEVHVDNTGGVNVADANRLLQQFQTEVSLLEGRARSERESGIVQALTASADAYKEFLRFRELDMRDAVDGRILLMGTLLDVAKKYEFPVERRGDTDWVSSGAALKLLLPIAKSKLAEAGRLINAG